MNQITAYRYEANNSGSYNELAAYAINLVANVSLFPSLNTIVIDESASEGVGKFIDSKGLDFHISPIEIEDGNIGDLVNSETVDAATLRQVIIRMRQNHDAAIDDMVEQLNESKKKFEIADYDRDIYQQMYRDSVKRSDRVKTQIQAIASILSTLYPERTTETA